MRSTFDRMVRRASVGCAVNTNSTDKLSSKAEICSTPTFLKANASPMDSLIGSGYFHLRAGTAISRADFRQQVDQVKICGKGRQLSAASSVFNEKLPAVILLRRMSPSPRAETECAPQFKMDGVQVLI
jgi:hypothetical protein